VALHIEAFTLFIHKSNKKILQDLVTRLFSDKEDKTTSTVSAVSQDTIGSVLVVQIASVPSGHILKETT
jgi:hypothetical protein